MFYLIVQHLRIGGWLEAHHLGFLRVFNAPEFQTTAAIVLSLFAMGRLVTTVVAWFYGVAVLREVVGWSRRLAWTLCPNIFLLRQFREYNRGPPADPTAPPPGADAEGGYPVRKEGVWTTDKNAAKRDTVFLEEAARVHRPQGHGHGRPNPHRKKELDDEVV